MENGNASYTTSKMNSTEFVDELNLYSQIEYDKDNWMLDENGKLAIRLDPIEVTSISLDKSEWSGRVGDGFTINAMVYPENASDKTIEWTSSDEAVATVDSEGNVKVIGVGSAIIKATSGMNSSIYALCIVTATPIYVESIILDPYEWHGEVADEFSTTAIVIPENASNHALVWSSSDSDIASVNEKGIVKLLKEGSCVITAKATDGSCAQATCIIDIVSSVDELLVEPTMKIYVFDTHGLLIREGYGKKILDNLDKDIYIIRQGNTVKRIVIH